MKNVLSHKGYYGAVEYSEEDNILFGQVLGISDLVSYEGSSVQELKEDFINGVDDYLNHCKNIGKEPNKPYSGKFTLRIDPELHAKLVAYAKMSGKSLNQYAEQVLARSIEA